MKSLQAIRVLSQNVDTYTHMDTQSVLAKQGAIQGTIVVGTCGQARSRDTHVDHQLLPLVARVLVDGEIMFVMAG